MGLLRCYGRDETRRVLLWFARRVVSWREFFDLPWWLLVPMIGVCLASIADTINRIDRR